MCGLKVCFPSSFQLKNVYHLEDKFERELNEVEMDVISSDEKIGVLSSTGKGTQMRKSLEA